MTGESYFLRVHSYPTTSTNLIESILPKGISKTNKTRLFSYPGPLHSFAAKISLAYAFRIIDKNLYDSLNALREVRNEAAHSPTSFSLHELNDRMRNVYNLGPDIPNIIKRQAVGAMMKLKFDNLNDLFDKYEMNQEDRKEQVSRMLDNPETMSNLEKQVPYYELIAGLCFVCGTMYYQKEMLDKLTRLSPIWASLADLIGEDNPSE